MHNKLSFNNIKKLIFFVGPNINYLVIPPYIILKRAIIRINIVTKLKKIYLTKKIRARQLEKIEKLTQ